MVGYRIFGIIIKKWPTTAYPANKKMINSTEIDLLSMPEISNGVRFRTAALLRR
jgi:hypothetical protein